MLLHALQDTDEELLGKWGEEEAKDSGAAVRRSSPIRAARLLHRIYRRTEDADPSLRETLEALVMGEISAVLDESFDGLVGRVRDAHGGDLSPQPN